MGSLKMRYVEIRLSDVDFYLFNFYHFIYHQQRAGKD